MLLHQDGAHRWLPALDRERNLVVTLDDATAETYSAGLGEEAGTMSSCQAWRSGATTEAAPGSQPRAEGIAEHGTPGALSTDRRATTFSRPRLTRGMPRRLPSIGVDRTADRCRAVVQPGQSAGCRAGGRGQGSPTGRAGALRASLTPPASGADPFARPASQPRGRERPATASGSMASYRRDRDRCVWLTADCRRRSGGAGSPGRPNPVRAATTAPGGGARGRGLGRPRQAASRRSWSPASAFG